MKIVTEQQSQNNSHRTTAHLFECTQNKCTPPHPSMPYGQEPLQCGGCGCTKTNKDSNFSRGVARLLVSASRHWREA
jgi:hypothetical protein